MKIFNFLFTLFLFFSTSFYFNCKENKSTSSMPLLYGTWSVDDPNCKTPSDKYALGGVSEYYTFEKSGKYTFQGPAGTPIYGTFSLNQNIIQYSGEKKPFNCPGGDCEKTPVTGTFNITYLDKKVLCLDNQCYCKNP